MREIPGIRKAKIEDAVHLAKDMKKMDKLECKYLIDETPLDSLLCCFNQTDAENYTIVDKKGYVYGMFGVNKDTELDGYGIVWLLSSAKLQKFPVAFFKQSRQWIEKLHKNYEHIYNFVFEENWQSLKWLQLCGFKPIGTKKLGNYNKTFILIMRSREQ